MLDIYLNTRGRISASTFRKHFMIASTLGFFVAFGVSGFLFGTFAVPFVPLMPNPDPLHQLLYKILPILLSAPLFIKRQHDRNRTPMLFILFAGLSVGLALFGEPGTVSTHPASQADIQAFVAKNVVQAPVNLVGLWLITECFFFKGTEGANQYGSPDEVMAK